MIEEVVEVVAVKGSVARLRAIDNSNCSSCSKGQGCGAGSLSRFFSNRRKDLQMDLKQAVQPGQKVKLAMPENQLLTCSLLLYLMPLIGLILFPGIALLVLKVSEPFQIGLALCGGYIGFVMAKQLIRRQKIDIQVTKIYPLSMPLNEIECS